MLNKSIETVELFSDNHCGDFYSRDEIKSVAGVPKSIIKNSIAASLLILKDMKRSHNRDFSQSENNVFLCLELVKQNRTVDVIAEHVMVSEDWVVSTILGLMYVYSHSSYRTIDSEEIIDFFDMNEKKAKMILWLFEFKGQIPERKHLLKWFDLNPIKDNDEKIINLILHEKLYWFCEAEQIPHFWQEKRVEKEKIYTINRPLAVSDSTEPSSTIE